jgi:hypothetical protein
MAKLLSGKSLGLPCLSQAKEKSSRLGGFSFFCFLLGSTLSGLAFQSPPVALYAHDNDDKAKHHYLGGYVQHTLLFAPRIKTRIVQTGYQICQYPEATKLALKRESVAGLPFSFGYAS